MRGLPRITANLPDLERGKQMLARVLRKRDTPEPVAAWRAVPEAELQALEPEAKAAYIEALLPLMRRGRSIGSRHLRRLYQLFTFMEVSPERRSAMLNALHTRLRLEPRDLPTFANTEVRKSLMTEAVAMAGRSPSAEAKAYLVRLREHLHVKSSDETRWEQFFQRLTDAENRVAAGLGKRGHIVGLDDRKLEIFKKAVASIGVPAALIFPLGTVGLTVEGITSGLIALGGGFVLPAGAAMVGGIGVVVAMGVSSKKILDMVWPTTGADKTSIDLQRLNADATQIQHLLDDAVADASEAKLKTARDEIARIVQKMLPLNEAERAKLTEAFEHARVLGQRYLEYLSQDRAYFESNNQIGADELDALLQLDTPAIA
ncbi:MAG: hypothetical protein ABSG46_03650 [Candidatus Binataceae bacterium]